MGKEMAIHWKKEETHEMLYEYNLNRETEIKNAKLIDQYTEKKEKVKQVVQQDLTLQKETF